MFIQSFLKSTRKGGLRHVLSLLLGAFLVLGLVPHTSQASLVPADEADPSLSLREANLAKIRSMIERREVAARLADYGLTEGEVSARLDQLTDDQVAEIAGRVDQINAGGDALGLVLTVLVIILLVLLILYLFGDADDLKVAGSDEAVATE